jgi:hypothetical protein
MKFITFVFISLFLSIYGFAEKFQDSVQRYYLIDLSEDCIDGIDGEKVYLKNEYLVDSNNVFFLFTNAYGILEIKNLCKDDYGFYLPKIEITPKKHPRITRRSSDFSIKLRGFNNEVKENLSDAVEHAAEAALGTAAAAAFAATGQPVLGGCAAGVAGKYVSKTVDDIQNAYNNWNKDHNKVEEPTNNNDHNTDSWDQASGR